jgi:STE24 endopeptidase
MWTRRGEGKSGSKNMRLLAAFAFAALLFLHATAHAATAPPFNPDEATRAWIATMGPEATARSNAYFEGGYWIQFAGPALAILISLAMMMLGWAKGVRAWLEKAVKAYFLVALGAGFFYLVVSTVLTFPFSWYVGFVREHEFRLSTQTLPEWFGEYLLSNAIAILIGSIFIALLYLVVRATKSSWWVWAAVATTAFLAFIIAVQPVFIAPLFNTYTPMAEGP